MTIKKIGSINALRFVAAMLVVFYHFAFVYFYRDIPYVDVPVLRNLSKYGYLGVDIFFIISGFVIALSAENRGAFDFVKSRIGRLYPVFWACAGITTLFLLLGGHLIHSELSWWRFASNMTMVPTILFPDHMIDFLDGSYWTLAVEMKFYAIVLLFLLFKQFKKIEKVSLVIAPIMLLSALFLNIWVESQLVWIPNFIAGILFYKIYKEGLTPWRIFGLANTFAASLIFTLQRVPFLEDGYGLHFSAIMISAYVFISYIMFLFISLDKIKVPNNTFVNTLGLLTYPVYLLHQQIARITFTFASEKNIPLYISFPGMLILIIGMSYAVHILVERRGKIALDRLLDKVTPSILKRL